LQDLTLTDRKGKIFHLSDRTGPVLQHQTDDQKIMIFQGGSINATGRGILAPARLAAGKNQADGETEKKGGTGCCYQASPTDL
jgi:hypothetical protein